MIRRRELLAVTAATALLMQTGVGMAAAPDTELKVGQVWTYRDPIAAASRVVIGKIDDDSGTRVISISVTDVPVPTTTSTTQTLGHSPFQEKALRESLIGLEGDQPLPDNFASGYEVWKQKFDAGSAGYFTISVSEAVTAIVAAMSNNGKK